MYKWEKKIYSIRHRLGKIIMESLSFVYSTIFVTKIFGDLRSCIHIFQSISHSNHLISELFYDHPAGCFACRFHSAVELLLRCQMVITGKSTSPSQQAGCFFKQFSNNTYRVSMVNCGNPRTILRTFFRWKYIVANIENMFLKEQHFVILRPELLSLYFYAVTLIIFWDPLGTFGRSGLWRHGTADFHLENISVVLSAANPKINFQMRPLLVRAPC